MAAVRKMPWGKHKGIPLTDVDTGYLEWALINSTTLKPRLKSWLLDELTSRDINLAAKYRATDALSRFGRATSPSVEDAVQRRRRPTAGS